MHTCIGESHRLLCKIRILGRKQPRNLGINGIKVVCNPTSTDLLNIYEDLLQRTALTPFLKNCEGLHLLGVGCGVGRWAFRVRAHASSYVVLVLFEMKSLIATKDGLQKFSCV